MIHSEHLAELAVALSAAQGDFEAVPKGNVNPFFSSKYAALPDIVKAASPILSKHGLSVSQLLGHDEQGDTLTTVLLHKSGQFLADTMHLRPVKDDPQAQGSATTYGRRYSYMAALGLVADEDDDGNAGSGRGTAKRPARQRGASSVTRPLDELKALANTDKVKAREALRALGVEPKSTLAATLAGMSADQVSEFRGLMGDGEPLLPGNGDSLKGRNGG